MESQLPETFVSNPVQYWPAAGPLPDAQELFKKMQPFIQMEFKYETKLEYRVNPEGKQTEDEKPPCRNMRSAAVFLGQGRLWDGFSCGIIYAGLFFSHTLKGPLNITNDRMLEVTYGTSLNYTTMSHAVAKYKHKIPIAYILAVTANPRLNAVVAILQDSRTHFRCKEAGLHSSSWAEYNIIWKLIMNSQPGFFTLDET